jgi:RNase P subunit RPR2
MTIPPRKIITMNANYRTQIMHGLHFKTLHCLKCHAIIADGIYDDQVQVKSKPSGNFPIRITCRNCKTENFICQ